MGRAKKLVPPAGFEPAAIGIEVRCSVLAELRRQCCEATGVSAVGQAITLLNLGQKTMATG